LTRTRPTQSRPTRRAAGARLINVARDRRRNRRYRIQLKLHWRLTGRKKSVLDEDVGRTLDVSSGGIYFQTSRPLPVGESLQVSIDWPVMLHNITPLQVVVTGTIFRSTREYTAVQILQHEFRTVGSMRNLSEFAKRDSGGDPSPGGRLVSNPICDA
jgi:hypothetical protein